MKNVTSARSYMFGRMGHLLWPTVKCSESKTFLYRGINNHIT